MFESCWAHHSTGMAHRHRGRLGGRRRHLRELRQPEVEQRDLYSPVDGTASAGDSSFHQLHRQEELTVRFFDGITVTMPGWLRAAKAGNSLSATTRFSRGW